MRSKIAICWLLIFSFKQLFCRGKTVKHRSLLIVSDLIQSLDKVNGGIDSKLFLYQTPEFKWIPSSVYRYDDFRESLNALAMEGVAGKKFYVGEEVGNGHVYGLVNVAAFLAQSMKETIQ